MLSRPSALATSTLLPVGGQARSPYARCAHAWVAWCSWHFAAKQARDRHLSSLFYLSSPRALPTKAAAMEPWALK